VTVAAVRALRSAYSSSPTSLSSSSSSSPFARLLRGAVGSHGRDPSSPLDDVYRLMRDQQSIPAIQSKLASCLAHMNKLKLEHIGLTEHGIAAVRYSRCMNIASNKDFDITVFVLPANSVIPLHDHPGMFMLSKVLCGALHVRSYTALTNEGNFAAANSVVPAKVSMTSTKNVSDGAWLLSPQEGNIHEFRTEVPTAIFEVLTPPYNDGRCCTYYKAKPVAQHNVVTSNDEGPLNETVMLEKLRESPDELLPILVRYLGPTVK
jgi:hypothetical protein